jgi:hypothetical protein
MDQQLKPGFKSSEFYLKLAATLCAALMGSGLFMLSDNPILQGLGVVIGVAGSMLSAMGYEDKRFQLKGQAGSVQLQQLLLSREQLRLEGVRMLQAAKSGEAKPADPQSPSA